MHLPTQIIILGGSGDLSKRKLFPALFDLFDKGKLPEQFQIIGLARTPRSDEEYRELVSEAVHNDGHDHSTEKVENFCSHVVYAQGAFDNDSSYEHVQEKLTDFETKHGDCSNKLFYLAVSPNSYETIFEKLHGHKLHVPCRKDHEWVRVLVEKPFGNDYKSAQDLDKKLSTLFGEEQIFRIDHYLAKEAVQNILSFRFANMLLRSPWNKDHIKEVRFTMHESIDVETRGNFYDGIGALRDVGQNHLLQLIALIAMREPRTLTTEDIRRERTKVLRALTPFTKNTIKDVTRAQYDGYTGTEGVADDSTTETFFAFKTFVNLREWKNVPFYVTAGKALAKSEVSIEITFKDVATGPFETDDCQTVENSIVLTISPEQTMAITLNAKAPGLGFNIESRTLEFTCDKGSDEIKNSYEKVLLDCIEGDQSLFASTTEVLAAWKFVASIIENWEKAPLKTYVKGSGGPALSGV